MTYRQCALILFFIMRRKGTRDRQRLRRWVHGFIAVIAVFTLLFSLAIGIFVAYVRTLPPIEQLENYSPPQATSLFDRTGRVKIATMAQQNRVVVPLDKIPPVLRHAFISIEDKRFYSHIGIDPFRIARAMMVNLSRGRFAQGASTITQQLPRNLLKSVSRRKIFSRKIKETLLAFQIERRYSKDQILEFYLNQIYLGNGAYGVQAAARTFFNKDVSRLTVGECAVIAGIPQMPYRYSPLNNLGAATKRRNIILNLMAEQGFITRTQYEDAISTGIQVSPPPPGVNLAPYFVDYVRRYLTETGEMDNEGLYQNGYTIFTTIDMDLQGIADEELRKGLRAIEVMLHENAVPGRLAEEQMNFGGGAPVQRQRRLARITRVFSDSLNVEIGGYLGTVSLKDALPCYQPERLLRTGELADIIITKVDRTGRTFFADFAEKKPLQGAVVILDARTGYIIAMSGGENFYDFQNNGQWNRAEQGPGRQPGSAAKPFVFAGALESGKTLASFYDDRRIVFPDGYTPRNYENRYFGLTPIQTALEHSRNVVTVLLYLDMKPARTMAFIRKFDFLSERSSWQFGLDPTVCLGSFSATPLSMAAAYTPFVHRGIGVRPVAVRKVMDTEQKEILRPIPFEREVVSPQTAYMMTYAMEGVIKRGTGRSFVGDVFAGQDMPEMAGKTGTTNDCIDAWFIGYTPDLIVCVWVGYDDNRSLGEGMTGGRVAGPIWRDIIRRAVQIEPYRQKTFAVPGGLEFADVCSHSGQLAKDSCRLDSDSEVYDKMPFLKGSEPTQYCTYH